MNLTRKYKISKITKKALTKKEKLIIEYIKFWLKSLISLHDENSNSEWMNYHNLFANIENKYDVKGEDAVELLKIILKDLTKEIDFDLSKFSFLVTTSYYLYERFKVLDE